MKIRTINLVDIGGAISVVKTKPGFFQVQDKYGTGSRWYEPIGIEYLASMLISRGFEARVIARHNEVVSLEEVLEGNPQVIGFSALTYNYHLVRELATMVKSKRPDAITVIGGYHATALPEEVSIDPAFDYLIAKEADLSFADFVEYLNGQRRLDKVRGLVYRAGNLLVDNFQRLDPDCNPMPLRSTKVLAGSRMVDLHYPAPSEQRLAVLLWSRGCNHNCKFCVSSQMFPKSPGKSKQVERNIGNIVEEIKYCQDYLGINSAFVCDLNFEDKDRAQELCQAVGRTGIKWYGMARLDADPDIFSVMRSGGCTKVGFGIESLVSQRKNGAADIVEWRKLAIEKASLLRELGMFSKYYYILGGEGETLDEIEEEAQAICEIDCDLIRLGWMTPFPGTADYRRAVTNDLLVSYDWRDFSTDIPLYRIEGVTIEELQKTRMDIYRRFYRPGRYAKVARNMVDRFPHLGESYRQWNEILLSSIGQGFA